MADGLFHADDAFDARFAQGFGRGQQSRFFACRPAGTEDKDFGPRIQRLCQFRAGDERLFAFFGFKGKNAFALFVNRAVGRNMQNVVFAVL